MPLVIAGAKTRDAYRARRVALTVLALVRQLVAAPDGAADARRGGGIADALAEARQGLTGVSTSQDGTADGERVSGGKGCEGCGGNGAWRVPVVEERRGEEGGRRRRGGEVVRQRFRVLGGCSGEESHGTKGSRRPVRCWFAATLGDGGRSQCGTLLLSTEERYDSSTTIKQSV